MAKIDLKYATLTIRDGSSTPNQVEIKVGDGTLSYTEAKTIEYVLDRGNLDTVREGDQVPMDISFDFIWEFIRAVSTVDVTIEDALKKTGGAAAWVSTSSDACEPYAVDIVVVYKPPCGGEQWEKVVLPDFRYESLQHDIKAGTVSVSGKSNSTAAVVTRLASTTGTGSNP